MSFYTVSWDDASFVELSPMSSMTICSCCGSQLLSSEYTPRMKKDILAEAKQGIIVIPEKIDGVVPKNPEKSTLHVVETTNGPITVSIRHAW